MRRPALYYWPQRTGRPRERWRVSDYPPGAVPDANELRRQSFAEEQRNNNGGRHRLNVRYADRAGTAQTASIAIETLPHAVKYQPYGARQAKTNRLRLRLPRPSMMLRPVARSEVSMHHKPAAEAGVSRQSEKTK